MNPQIIYLCLIVVPVVLFMFLLRNEKERNVKAVGQLKETISKLQSSLQATRSMRDELAKQLLLNVISWERISCLGTEDGERLFISHPTKAELSFILDMERHCENEFIRYGDVIQIPGDTTEEDWMMFTRIPQSA